MNKVRVLIEAMPYFMGVKYPEQIKELFLLAYENELKNIKSVFNSSKEYMDNGNRFNFLYSIKCKNRKKRDYIILLYKVIEYMKYAKKDKKYYGMYSRLLIKATKQEKKNKDVSKLISVSEIKEAEARGDSFWKD